MTKENQTTENQTPVNPLSISIYFKTSHLLAAFLIYESFKIFYKYYIS